MAYTNKQKEEIFDKVIEYITNGMSLRTAISQKDVFSRTIWDELLKEEDKKARYARAREERADKIFDEMLEIADKQGEDFIETEEGGYVNHNVINRNKLQIDTRKWMLSKMNPKKYGDKLELDNNINLPKEIKGITFDE